MTADETIQYIEEADSWDQRVARLRQVPQRHGTGEHAAIYAEVARRIYIGHLAPDFAYYPSGEFYELAHFEASYAAAYEGTAGFTNVSPANLAATIQVAPASLLTFRVITGLLKNEFAASTKLVAEPLGLAAVSPGKVDSMERSGTAVTDAQAKVLGETLHRILTGTLFGEPPGEFRSKQQKPDTADGWDTVRSFAEEGVPYATFLHQRHYGGAFRQVLDAMSEARGNLIEDAVEALFQEHGIQYIRTGSHNQGEIAERFEVTVTPAPDFVVFDEADHLRAMLECKGANDGGTARDKALRFRTLHDESVRLGGVPLLAVLSGLGWLRVNDTLGPVVRDCDGRVFTLSNLPEMMSVSPFTLLAS